MKILTLRQCANVVKRFKDGETVAQLTDAYGVMQHQVESIIRCALNNQGKLK